MSYYMGDYYQGDYYQGDPGFFSFLGRLAKGVVSSFTGLPLGGGGGSVVKMAPQTALALPGRAGTVLSKIRGGMQKIGPIAIGAGAAGAAASAGAGYMMGRRGRKVAIPGMKRRHRMNVCNPRALRRAIRRTHGFSKLAMRTIHLVHPKKKVRFGGFKRRTKRRA